MQIFLPKKGFLLNMEPANLLFIMSDEHDPRYMGSSGHPIWKPLMHTPALDALADRGTRFTSAYTTCPICVPARASFATGRYVHEIGYWDNAMAYDGRVRGWGHNLQDAGIPVESIGKLHYRKDDDPTGFDRQHHSMQIWEGIGMVWGSNRRPLEKMLQDVSPHGIYTPESNDQERISRIKVYKNIGPGESGYNRYDREVADLTIEWLERRGASSIEEEKPWVLFVGFVAPHFPLVVPQEFYDLYPINRLPPPKLHPRDGHPRHPWHFAFGLRDQEFEEEERRMQAMASYLGLTSFLDHQVGRILDTLDQTGLSRNTRVVYTSDHGENLGARGLWGKSCLYQESTLVPLIMAGPDIPANHVVDTPVDFVDCQPTILEATGLNPNEQDLPSKGRSLFQILGEPYDDQRVAFSEYHAAGSPAGAFMLRKGRYKYHYYVGFEPELFNLLDDPEETRNLATDPKYRKLLESFETSLRDICNPEEIDRKAKEDQDALIERFGGPEKARSMGTQGATPVPGGTHE
jgi:choline-sulfatase